MQLSFREFIKGQLMDLIESYYMYFKKTFSIAVMLSVATFLSIAILFYYSTFDVFNRPENISLLNYFFGRKRTFVDSYEWIDLSRIVFLVFTALFSVVIWREERREQPTESYSWNRFVKQITPKDLLVLLLTTGLAALMDLFFFWIGDLMYGTELTVSPFSKWIYWVIYEVRKYLPCIIFSLVSCKLVNRELNFKVWRAILFLCIPLWAWNLLVYDFGFLVRNLLFSPLLSPFSEESRLIYESILGVGLVAIYFVGFYSIFTALFRLEDEKRSIGISINDL